MKKEVAGFTKRIIAYIIDIFIINTLILRPFKPFLPKTLSFQFSLSKELFIITFSTAMITLLYFTLLELLARQSIGKIITRVYVSSLTKTLTLQQCIIRNVTKIATPVLVLDTLYAVINKTHQRYFERLSKTEVLKVPLK